jgi:L-aminopeptidase/D-esterase-like protein
MFKGYITDIDGLLAAHETDEKGRTGCTIVLAPRGAVGPWTCAAARRARGKLTPFRR